MTEEDEICTQNKHAPSLTVFMSGSISSTLCAILLQPFDVVTTRIQNPKVPQKGMKKTRRAITTLKYIWYQEKLTALWYGTGPTIIRGIPAGGLYFCTFDWLKERFIKRTPTKFEFILLSMISRATTDCAVIPLTVVKTRTESGVYKYKTTFNALKLIYREEGIKGLTSGLPLVLARDLPLSALYILFYTHSKTKVPERFHQNYSNLVNSTCAGISAVLSTLLTHPPDVIKTQMQLYPKKYPTIYAAFQRIRIEHGLSGYYLGLFPRLVKRTLFAVISWTMYENVKQDQKNKISNKKKC